MSEIKELKMDRKEVGIAVYNYKSKDFARIKGEIVIFDNMKSAKSYIAAYVSTNPIDYRLFLSINKDYFVLFDRVEKFDNHYEFYDSDTDTWYFISESTRELVESVGYFVYADGDNKDSAEKFTLDNNKNLIYDIIITFNTFLNLGLSCEIESITRDDYGYCVNIKNSCETIHIMTNSDLVRFNIDRKDSGNRCIPFDKNMDKYKSVVVFVTTRFSYSKKTADKLINNVVDDLNRFYPFKYSKVEYKGKIFIE